LRTSPWPGQAGYLIWNPRTKSLKVSADVSFDETFQSAGPRRHKSFADVLPTMLPDAIPTICSFTNTVPEDDHYSPPLLEYHEEVPTDGFLQMTTTKIVDELYDLDEADLLQTEPTDYVSGGASICGGEYHPVIVVTNS
jgi:hypothetical protein